MKIFNSYKELIDFARFQNRSTNDKQYYEKHHITPRSLGGNNSKDNIVLLTLGEHVQAHYLLAIENKNNPVIYNKMLASCIIILHPKNYKKKDKELAVKEYLLDDEVLLFYEKTKQSFRESLKNIEGFNKGKKFIFNRTWVQIENQRPISVGDKRLKSLVCNGAKIIYDCPICGEKNSRDNYCCCEEHLKIAEENRKKIIKEFQSEHTKKVWETTDNSKRLENMKKNKKSIKGLYTWVTDGEKNIYIKKEDLEKYEKLGYKKGCTLENNPVKYRSKVYKWTEESLKKRSETARIRREERKKDPEWVKADFERRSKMLTGVKRKPTIHTYRNDENSPFINDDEIKQYEYEISTYFKYYCKCNICGKVYTKLLKNKTVTCKECATKIRFEKLRSKN